MADIADQQFWLNHTGFFLFCVAIFGLIIGSFLNVVILRLPAMMEREFRRECELFLDPDAAPSTPPAGLSLADPPSTCPHCGHRIRAWENIPLISYAALRGRCAGCSARISVRYPLIEALSAAAAVAVALRFGPSPQMIAVLLLTWTLIALAAIDIDHKLLPDSMTLPLLWLGLIVNRVYGFVPFDDAFWGAIAGYLILWSVYWAFRLLTGKEGMGFGDFKLLGALGAWMGWQALPAIIILSSMSGAVVGIAMILLGGRDRTTPVPFGPFLALAGWLALVWGEALAGLPLLSAVMPGP